MEFLDLLDSLHKKVMKDLCVPRSNRNFISYHSIGVGDNTKPERFRIQKTLTKAKLLIIDGQQQVYLSDSQIIETILELPSNEIDWFINQLVQVYLDKGSEFAFTIGEETFTFLGLESYPEGKTILLPSDTKVDINEFIFLVNFIIAKDTAWERMPISAVSEKKGYDKTNFSKRTLSKYISLLDYYGMHTSKSVDFLSGINYPLSAQYSGQVDNEKEMFSHAELFDISLYL